jgi:capsular exopolysaccharide synthesis family protein
MKTGTLNQLFGQEGKGFFSRKTLVQYWRNWYWFLFSVSLGVVSAFIFLRYKTPEYRISASLLVKDDTKGSDFGDAIALESLGLPTGKSNVDNEVEILKSRSLIESVIRDLQIYTQYFAKGDVKTTELYETSPIRLQFITSNRQNHHFQEYILTSYTSKDFVITDLKNSWDGKFGDTLRLPAGLVIIEKTGHPLVSHNTYSIRINTLEESVKRYSNALRIFPANKMVSMINLAFTDILPEKGERILMKHIDNYLAGSIADKNRIADSTIAFIDQNLQLVSMQLKAIETEIEVFRKSNHIADMSVFSRTLVENSVQNRADQSAIKTQLKLIESLEKFFQNNPEQRVPASLILQEPNFIQLLNKYNELQIARSNLLLSQTNAHPTVKNLDHQINLLLENIEMGIEAKKLSLRINASQLDTYQRDYNAQIDKIPGKERVSLDFAREQQIKQELYIFLLKKRIETSLSKSSTLANGRIIDLPKADMLPVSPNRQLVLLISLLVGFGIPIALINFRNILNTKITGKAEIQANTDIPVVCEIGHKTGFETNIFSSKNKPVSEQFRVLRSNLLFLTGMEKRSVLLTSSMAGEGKSFVALNLAMSLALTGKRVVLLEFDFRKPRFAVNLGLKKPGITDYLISKTGLEDFIQPSLLSNNFDIMTCGMIPPNPAELILLPKTAELISLLKERYDYLLMDSAPVGIVTDARILSPYADITLYIIRQQYTFRQQLSNVQELSSNGQFPKLSIVLNDVKNTPEYGYDYRYDQEKTTRSFFGFLKTVFS